MAMTSARGIVSIQEKGHFEHEDARINKYTLSDELPAKMSEIRLRPRVTEPNYNYTIRRLTSVDREPILRFLRKFFFRDEPMNKAVNLLETPESRCIELEEYTASTLGDDVSLAAVDEQGRFVGVVVNGIAIRKNASTEDKSEDCPNPKFCRILKVLSHLEQEARVWDQVPAECDKILEIRIASTDTAWRGRGLMRVLCEESERLGMEKGACAVRMDTTSAFSAAAAERLSYKNIYCVRYEELPEGPQPEPPHLEARVYMKLL